MTNKICIKCQKLINDNEHFITIIESDKGEILKTNYCHIYCWKDRMDSKGKINKAFEMVEQLVGGMQDQGMLPPKKVVIQ